MENKLSDPIGQRIIHAHRRYLKVMEGERLAAMAPATKASYLQFLSLLTDKLERPGKPLSEVVRELMAEIGPIVLQALQG